MRDSRFMLVLLILIVCSVFTNSALASDSASLGLDLGIAQDNISGDVVDATNALSSEPVDLKEDMGLSSGTSFKLGLNFSWQNWYAEVGYQNIAFDGEEVLSRAVNFGGVIFDVATTLTSEFLHTYYRAELYYTFGELHGVNRPVGYSTWGIGVGLHYFDLQADVVGEAVGVRQRKEKQRAAPMPSIGGLFSTQIAQDWELLAKAQAMYTPELNGLQGAILAFECQVARRVSEQFLVNLSLGATYLKVDVDRGTPNVDQEVWDTDLTSIWGGIGVTYTF